MREPMPVRERLSRQMARLRWAVPVVVLALAAVHQALVNTVSVLVAPEWRPAVAIALYTLTGSIVAGLGLTWLVHAWRQHEQAEADLQRATSDLAQVQDYLHLLYDLGRQVANAADTQDVFALAAQVPVDVLGARATAVVSLDTTERRATLEMAWGLSDEAVATLRRVVDAGLPVEACRHCRPLSARLRDSCPLLTPLHSAGCAGTPPAVVCMPVGRGDERQAIIASYVDAAPQRERVQLLNILATELSAALESVQLRSRRLATLASVERTVPHLDDLDALLGHALDTLLSGWSADAGAVLLWDEAGAVWNVRAHRGLGEDLSSPAFERVLRWAEEMRAAGRAPYWPTLAPGDRLAAAVVVPLAVEGAIIGALLLGAPRPDAFGRGQATLLMALGHQLALTVRNAQLSARLRQVAMLEERYRLSREIHDGLAQMLGALGLELERVERSLAAGHEHAAHESLRAARDAAAEAYVAVREAIEGLRATIAVPGGLVAALREYAADFAARTGLIVECVGPEEPMTLPAETALHLLRIAQEALTNIRRHAHARHVWLRLALADGWLELSITDDGRGFDPALPRGRRHLGLATMRERARALGGQFTLATSPGAGTRVIVRLPLDGRAGPAFTER